MEELYPPGTRVKRIDPTTNMLLAGTVLDVPLSMAPSDSSSYQILFDNGTSASISLTDMPSLILDPPIPMSAPVDSLSEDSFSLLLPFLSVNSWITYEHEGAYHKGFLTCKPCGVYHFRFKTHVKKKSEDWGVDLPNLPFNWADLCTEGVLVSGHVVHSFLCPSSPSVSLVLASPPSTFDPVASIVSVINLHWHCPPSLLQALAMSHPDWERWLQSYYKEKGGIESLGTFKCLTLGEHCALQEKGAPKAILTMCVSTIKKD
jgi:hypothetical protein